MKNIILVLSSNYYARAKLKDSPRFKQLKYPFLAVLTDFKDSSGKPLLHELHDEYSTFSTVYFNYKSVDYLNTLKYLL